jgi:hypothetical protein
MYSLINAPGFQLEHVANVCLTQMEPRCEHRGRNTTKPEMRRSLGPRLVWPVRGFPRTCESTVRTRRPARQYHPLKRLRPVLQVSYPGVLYELVSSCLAEKASEGVRFESLHIARAGRGTPKDSQGDGPTSLRYVLDLALTRAAGDPHRPAGPIERTLHDIEAVVVDCHALLHQHCDPRC